ncbi:MAG: HAD hydrolase-like protein [Bacteroidia bacterium]|nr:HAD hydrolase-like protein [Bacteroidia bacterium]
MMTSDFKAAILDLDGVITQTANLHAKAWKQLFDQYNKQRQQAGKPLYRDFDPLNDYSQYIDGIPRYDGVRNFLQSRNVILPEGLPDDEKTQESISGLGNWKNELFHQLLEEEGVQVYESTLTKIKQWRQAGLKTAVISSSKNCKMILEKAGIANLLKPA